MTRVFSLRESTGYLVNRLAAAMTLALERELAPFDVTAQQWALLATLAQLKSASVMTLGAELGIDIGGASRLIDRLENKRLVSRRRTREDGRRARVELTAQGRALVPKLVDRAERVLACFHAPLSVRERDQLDRLLRRAIDAAPSPDQP